MKPIANLKFAFYLCVILLGLSAIYNKLAHSTVSFGSPDGYAMLCATTYMRDAPHHCQFNSNAAPELWTIAATGCNTHTLTTVPTNAKAVDLEYEALITSTNAVNAKQIQTVFYNADDCAQATSQVMIHAREFVAVGADTELYRMIGFTPRAIATANKVSSNTTFTNTGVSTQVIVRVRGYYD